MPEYGPRYRDGGASSRFLRLMAPIPIGVAVETAKLVVSPVEVPNSRSWGSWREGEVFVANERANVVIDAHRPRLLTPIPCVERETRSGRGRAVPML